MQTQTTTARPSDENIVKGGLKSKIKAAAKKVASLFKHTSKEDKEPFHHDPSVKSKEDAGKYVNDDTQLNEINEQTEMELLSAASVSEPGSKSLDSSSSQTTTSVLSTVIASIKRFSGIMRKPRAKTVKITVAEYDLLQTFLKCGQEATYLLMNALDDNTQKTAALRTERDVLNSQFEHMSENMNKFFQEAAARDAEMRNTLRQLFYVIDDTVEEIDECFEQKKSKKDILEAMEIWRQDLRGTVRVEPVEEFMKTPVLYKKEKLSCDIPFQVENTQHSAVSTCNAMKSNKITLKKIGDSWTAVKL